MDIDSMLGIEPEDEKTRHARSLLEADRRLVADLVERRSELGLSQREVARRMDSDQSTVARIESGARDLHQSTIRRYAMAVDAIIEHRVIAASARRGLTASFAAAVAGQVLDNRDWFEHGDAEHWTETGRALTGGRRRG